MVKIADAVTLNFYDDNSYNFSLGTFDRTNTTAKYSPPAGVETAINITINITQMKYLQYYSRSDANFTSRVYDTGFTNSTWGLVDFTKDNKNSSDIVGIIMDDGSNNATMFFKNGTHANSPHALTAFTAAIPFGGRNFTWRMLGTNITLDALAIIYDDDAGDNLFAIMANQSTISAGAVGNLALASNQVYTAYSTWSYNYSSVVCNVSDIIGGFVDTAGSDVILACRNGSIMIDADSELPPLVFSNSSRIDYINIGSDAMSKVVGIAYDATADDVAVFLRNGTYVADQSQAVFSESSPISPFQHLTYKIPYNQNLTETANVTLFTQVSNDSTTWSSWTERNKGATAVDVARYSRYKAIFYSPDNLTTPYFSRFNWTYVEGAATIVGEPINITYIDSFNRPNNATIGTGNTKNESTNYNPAWEENEGAACTFDITSNSLKATIVAGTCKMALRLNQTLVGLNKNQSIIEMDFSGLVTGEKVNVIKFNDSVGNTLYNFTCIGNAVAGNDCSDTNGAIFTGVADTLYLKFNFSSNGTKGFNWVRVTAAGVNYDRAVDNNTRNITSLEALSYLLGTPSIPTIGSINFTNGTNTLAAAVAADDCTYTTGDWVIDDGSSCEITTDVYVYPNNLYCSSGIIRIYSSATITVKRAYWLQGGCRIWWQHEGTSGKLKWNKD